MAGNLILRIWRRTIFLLVMLSVQISSVFGCSRSWFPATHESSDRVQPSAQPHILFVMMDDLGFSDIGYHGSEIETPNLDRLADNGVRLENYYVQPLCTPSRSQLMSGRYQIHTGLQHGKFSNNQPIGLPLDSPTLADKLREAGYSTHMVGKWHLGFYKTEYLPTNRGFDTYYGNLGGSCDHYDHIKCIDSTDVCGFDFHDMTRDNSSVVWDTTGKYSTHLITKRVVKIVTNHNPDKPLFLFVSYQAAHPPLQVPHRFEAMYDHIDEWKRRVYAGMVTAVDDSVGIIASAFRKTGLWKDTVMVFSTDNGAGTRGGSNFPLRGGKGSLWEGGIRAVGFVSGRQLKNKGTINKGLIHISDWFPTLVKLANGTLNGTKPLDGVDVWEAISLGKPSPRREILHSIDPASARRGRAVWVDTFDSGIKAAIRMDDWKLLTGNPGRLGMKGNSRRTTLRRDQNVWLFNMAADPFENHDVSRLYPGKVHEMLERLAYYNSTAVPVVFPSPDDRSDPRLRSRVWEPWR